MPLVEIQSTIAQEQEEVVRAGLQAQGVLGLCQTSSIKFGK
jgi:hypothetical protein